MRPQLYVSRRAGKVLLQVGADNIELKPSEAALLGICLRTQAMAVEASYPKTYDMPVATRIKDIEANLT